METIWRLIMYKFLLTMWKLNRLSEADVDLAVMKAIITEGQGLQIKNTAR
jgi:hypothetical protein